MGRPRSPTRFGKSWVSSTSTTWSRRVAGGEHPNGHTSHAKNEERDAQRARTIAQDEESCVVYGMPKEAVKRGGVERSVPLSAIDKDILHQLTLSES